MEVKEKIDSHEVKLVADRLRIDFTPISDVSITDKYIAYFRLHEHGGFLGEIVRDKDDRVETFDSPQEAVDAAREEATKRLANQ